MRSFFFFLVIFSGLHAGAQNRKLDSLYRQLAKAPGNKEKIIISNRIASELRSINADSALSLAQNALRLSEQENYEYGIAMSYISMAHANGVKSHYELSNDYAKRANIIADKLNNDSLRAVCLLIISSYNFNKGNYDLSIEKALAAMKLFEKRNDFAGILRVKTLMSQVYQLKNDLPRAEGLLYETLALFPKIDDSKTKLNTLHTLANVYGMEGKFKEALALDSQGIKICDVEKTHFLKSSFYDNMANCYMYSNRFEEAKKYFLLCLQIDSSFGNKKQMSDTYLNLGTLMFMQKKYPEAKQYLDHSISLADSTGYKQGKYSAYLLLSDLYKVSNETDKALAFLKQAYELKDSLINENTESKIVELETVYQTEKKEQQLQAQKYEIQKKNYLLWGFVFIALLLIIAAVSIYNKRQLQNKLAFQSAMIKQQDMAARAVIKAEENERRRIAADLHDGVGQMMSAAKMNLSVFENEILFKDEQQRTSFENVIGLVDESCKEIRSVSHQMMPNALLKGGLVSAVKEFIDKLDSRVIKVSLHAEGLDERVDNNTETVLYRVIQECVNNVLKHSGADHLDISLIKDTDGISATIEDNGKGFDSSDKQNFEGIGLKNIISRINYLKGSIDFDSSPGKGTLVAIHVPLS